MARNDKMSSALFCEFDIPYCTWVTKDDNHKIAFKSSIEVLRLVNSGDAVTGNSRTDGKSLLLHVQVSCKFAGQLAFSSENVFCVLQVLKNSQDRKRFRTFEVICSRRTKAHSYVLFLTPFTSFFMFTTLL